MDYQHQRCIQQKQENDYMRQRLVEMREANSNYIKEIMGSINTQKKCTSSVLGCFDLYHVLGNVNKFLVIK